MLIAALDRHRGEREAQRKLADLRAGVVAAAIYNANDVREVGGKEKRWTAADFFASLRPAGPVRKIQPMHEQTAAIEAWNKLLGGRDLRKKVG